MPRFLKSKIFNILPPNVLDSFFEGSQLVSCFREGKDHQPATGSGSTRPGTNSAPESTRPRVNSAGSTRPVYFLMMNWAITHVTNKKFGRYDLEYAR